MGNADEGSTRDQLYPELAKANLLRMRGDRKGAIEQCLSVLKRAPEDLDAHLLIAEIYEEDGDLGQASQWYELALDIAPRHAGLKQKLETVQEELNTRENAGTTKNLTLPPEKPPTGLYLAVIVGIALVVGFGAYLIERHPSSAGVPPIDGTGTVVIEPPLEKESPTTPVASTTGTGPSTPTPDLGLPEEDRALLRSLGESPPSGATLVAAMQDPRSNLLTLTYAASSEANEPLIAAEGARGALGKVPSAAAAVVRVERAGKLTYLATVERSRLAETETASWREANPASDAWLRHVLQEEWGTAAGTASTGSDAAPATSAGP